jgi:hypothetical protein
MLAVRPRGVRWPKEDDGIVVSPAVLVLGVRRVLRI